MSSISRKFSNQRNEKWVEKKKSRAVQKALEKALRSTMPRRKKEEEKTPTVDGQDTPAKADDLPTNTAT